ncbi:MAG: hypothetical protein MJK04_26360 [Psychrosphaera sp.]|nr:hypothetical protein [Psychrosphaera sp.]
MTLKQAFATTSKEVVTLSFITKAQNVMELLATSNIPAEFSFFLCRVFNVSGHQSTLRLYKQHAKHPIKEKINPVALFSGYVAGYCQVSV